MKRKKEVKEIFVSDHNAAKSSYEHFALSCSWLVMIVILVSSRSLVVRNALFPVIFANFFGMFFHMFLSEKKIRDLLIASVMFALCIYGMFNFFDSLNS